MLLYKAWLETRWRFLIGLAVLTIMAAGIVLDYLAVQKLMPLATGVDGSGPLGQRLKEAIEVQREYRGFVWFQWFRQNLTQAGTLLAALLGSGSLIASRSGGALFTLSLPASRGRLLGARAATGLAELFLLAIVPSLVIPLFSPAIGQTYRFGDALVHGVCLFVAAGAFFSLALLLSTVFDDLWRPLLLTCAVAVTLAVSELVAPAGWRYGIFRVMSAETYFRGNGLPWPGLFAASGLAALMLYTAAMNLERRDF